MLSQPAKGPFAQLEQMRRHFQDAPTALPGAHEHGQELGRGERRRAK
jgi:hypothetical protein